MAPTVPDNGSRSANRAGWTGLETVEITGNSRNSKDLEGTELKSQFPQIPEQGTQGTLIMTHDMILKLWEAADVLRAAGRQDLADALTALRSALSAG